MSRKQFILMVLIAILAIAIVYVVATMPPHPSRYVETQLVIPPGLIYNSTSDELKFWLNFTPSDSNLYLSRIAHPDFPQEIPFHDPLDVSGTVIQFTITDYSIYWGTPFSGSSVALDLYFADINSDLEVHKTELRVKMP